MNKRRLQKLIYNVVIVVIVFAGIGFVISRFCHFGDVEYTDNAQVHQHITPQNTRVPGFIKEIRFEEFQPVHKGDTLVIIEDSEFRLNLAQAEANLSNAMAGKTVTGASINTTSNNVRVTDAGIEEVKIQLENAKREYERYAKLLSQHAVTQQQHDNVKTAYDTLKARYEQMNRQRQSVELVKHEQTNRLGQSEAGINLAKAQVNLARLNLSYTVIVATCDGVLGRKDISVGQLVQPGQTMVEIVDSSDMWVVANYRETQLPNIKVGAKVKITADAVPGTVYEGTVERVADATGAAFSIIPQDNATGNFVKVEQRVPVRISLKGNDKQNLAKLKAGLNVECEVKY